MQRINKREYLARLRNGERVFRTRHGFWSMPTHQQWEQLVKKMDVWIAVTFGD